MIKNIKNGCVSIGNTEMHYASFGTERDKHSTSDKEKCFGMMQDP